MRRILDADAGALWLARATRPYAFVSPTDGEEFALLLVVADADVTNEEQMSLSEQFVRAGCRNAVCFGPTSSTWDDSIDWVTVLGEIDGREEPFVMTSWFDHAPLDEAVFFFAKLTGFDDWVPEQFVAFVLGGDEALEREVERVLREHFDPPPP
ncbi:MAG: hypothetical protein H6835_15660 [Planctomycetes bacterium]|nr:hypothetical protein [Planctomycetota bacterium]